MQVRRYVRVLRPDEPGGHTVRELRERHGDVLRLTLPHGAGRVPVDLRAVARTVPSDARVEVGAEFVADDVETAIRPVPCPPPFAGQEDAVGAYRERRLHEVRWLDPAPLPVQDVAEPYAAEDRARDWKVRVELLDLDDPTSWTEPVPGVRRPAGMPLGTLLALRGGWTSEEPLPNGETAVVDLTPLRGLDPESTWVRVVTGPAEVLDRR
ncbi:MAG: hypothetical protein ACTHQ3_11635 [Motilibacteraceae bacterium]